MQNNFDWFKIDLNSTDYRWETVPVEEDKNKIFVGNGYGYFVTDAQLFMFGGSQNPGIKNSMIVFNLETSPVKFTYFSSNRSPSPRMFHTMASISEKLYLFGGEGDNNELYNDFWAYDCYLESWESIEAKGTIPSRRYGHGASTYNDVMVIWGGMSAEGYLNDGYIYSIATNS